MQHHATPGETLGAMMKAARELEAELNPKP
jgi:hypothetical protein